MKEMVPLSRASSNHLNNPDELFKTLDQWNEILRGRLADRVNDARATLPQSKAVERRLTNPKRKIGGGR
jgi:hypothetical protein